MRIEEIVDFLRRSMPSTMYHSLLADLFHNDSESCVNIFVSFDLSCSEVTALSSKPCLPVHRASHLLAKPFILHASTLIGLGSVTMISQPAIRQNTGNLIQAHLPSEQIVLY